MKQSIIAFAILGAAAWLQGCTQPEPPIVPQPFDKAIWDTADYGDAMDNPRYRMALSFVQQATLIDKSETEVRHMLGDPMYTIDDFPTHGARHLHYGVGPSTSLTGLDFHALFVELSAPSGAVTRTTIGRRNI